MAADKDFSLPTAQQVMEKLALAEAEKASAASRRQAELESEKKMLLEKITKPSGVSDDEALRRVRLQGAELLDGEVAARGAVHRGLRGPRHQLRS